MIRRIRAALAAMPAGQRAAVLVAGSLTLLACGWPLVCLAALFGLPIALFAGGGWLIIAIVRPRRGASPQSKNTRSSYTGVGRRPIFTRR